MLRALYSSAAGMKAQELYIDNTANNIANVNTHGFKRSQLNFADLLYTTLQQAGTSEGSVQSTPTGLQIGSGVRGSATTKSFTPGSLEQTSNPLDLAIQGDGFFKVLVNGEPRYTRAGALRMNENGQLVTAEGFPLADAVTIQDGVGAITISADGAVNGASAQDPAQVTQQGQIQLYRFLNPAGLSSEGNNVYAATAASGPEINGAPGSAGVGSLLQGFLEGSNVEVVTELIALISAQRAYEINSRAIRAGDEMLSTSADIIR